MAETVAQGLEAVVLLVAPTQAVVAVAAVVRLLLDWAAPAAPAS